MKLEMLIILNILTLNLNVSNINYTSKILSKENYIKYYEFISKINKTNITYSMYIYIR